MQVTCKKCQGTGYLRHYRHVLGGECFSCRGAGKYTKYQRLPNLLFNCKHCGSEPTYVYSMGTYQGVKCTKCSHRTPMLGYSCKQHAANKWNKLNRTNND